jgi:alanine dehydrogenase
MIIGVPKETYPLEKRVLVLPGSAKALVDAGHQVIVQTGAGKEIGISDEDYRTAGAETVSEPADLYDQAELVIKLKMPTPEEYSFMRPDTILFCMLHSEQNPQNIYCAGLQGLVAVEMEKIRDEKAQRLVNQTRITGKVGVYYALRHSPKLPEDMKAVILGYGNVSSGAITVCARLGIDYRIIRREEFKHVPKYLADADILINGIAWPKEERERQHYLVTRKDIVNSKPGMIVLDLSVDFANPIETVHPTTYSNPFYIDEDRVHISLYGYPGLVPETSSRIYSEQVLPLALTIADNGGLDGIENKGKLGKAISGAILDPKDHDWRQYRPEEPKGSKIE